MFEPTPNFTQFQLDPILLLANFLHELAHIVITYDFLWAVAKTSDFEVHVIMCNVPIYLQCI